VWALTRKVDIALQCIANILVRLSYGALYPYSWSLEPGLSVRPPARLPTCSPGQPTCSLRPVDLCARPTRKYSSIFKYIQAYSSIFEVFLKNIQRKCPVCPVCARHNGQDHPPACPLRPPVSLRMPSMTTLIGALRQRH
jgi:hypothetical protein